MPYREDYYRMNVSSDTLKETTRITFTGLMINLFLSSSKLAGGILSNSHALVADGVHSLSDCITDVVIIIGVKFWTRPSDANHPHGHARIETIISGFIGIFLILTGLFLAWESFRAIMTPSECPPGWLAFIVAVLAILLKGVLSRWTLKISRKLKSPALAANSMHQRSDAISSIPVAIVVLAARLDSSLIVLDGIGGVIVSILILKMGISVIRPALCELSDTAAPPEIIDEIRRMAMSVEGVRDVHNLRTRYQGDGIQTDMHIVVDGSKNLTDAFAILKNVERVLYEMGPGVTDVMVRLEPDSES
jgi:cation diffusion facilitator family transporter